FNVFIEHPRPRFIQIERGFVWRDGQFALVEQLRPLSSDWNTLFDAPCINNPGQVVGAGLTNAGLYLGYRAHPIPACPSGFYMDPQPQTVNPGATASFTVIAASGGGGAMSYQWQRNGADLADDSRISG